MHSHGRTIGRAALADKSVQTTSTVRSYNEAIHSFKYLFPSRPLSAYPCISKMQVQALLCHHTVRTVKAHDTLLPRKVVDKDVLFCKTCIALRGVPRHGWNLGELSIRGSPPIDATTKPESTFESSLRLWRPDAIPAGSVHAVQQSRQRQRNGQLVRFSTQDQPGSSEATGVETQLRGTGHDRVQSEPADDPSAELQHKEEMEFDHVKLDAKKYVNHIFERPYQWECQEGETEDAARIRFFLELESICEHLEGHEAFFLVNEVMWRNAEDIHEHRFLLGIVGRHMS